MNFKDKLTSSGSNKQLSLWTLNLSSIYRKNVSIIQHFAVTCTLNKCMDKFEYQIYNIEVYLIVHDEFENKPPSF